MKTSILSMLPLAGLLLFAACASEDTADNRQQEPDLKGLTAFSVEEKTPATRTAGEYTGTGIKFYWTRYDRLWVQDNPPHFEPDDKNDIADQLTASGTDRTPRAKFWFRGSYTAPQYLVYYGGDNTISRAGRVTIANKQKQDKPNYATGLGLYGDCGTGIARRQDNGNYSFMIDHKSSYVTFMPYTKQKGIANTRLEKITVTADKAISGEFKFDNDNGIDLSSRPATTATNSSIELTLNNFPIPLTAPDAAANAAVMVIAPGTYSKLTVEYTIYDDNGYPHIGTGVRGTITKEYSNVTFTAGKNKEISQQLELPEYPADTFYMWDAAVGQHYWKGYEWNGPNPQQPPFINLLDYPYPKDNTDPRWHREFPSGFTPNADNTAAAYSCKDCPNVNELYWYVAKGDPYRDYSYWLCMDHLFQGGTWLKKLSVIAAEEGKSVADLKNASPDGKDHRVENITTSQFAHINQGKLTDRSNYFYLPDLGFYNQTGSPGWHGYYWSSTPFFRWTDVPPKFDRIAYSLFLFGTWMHLQTNDVTTGLSTRWPTDR